mgnify:CR=1 FL=1
MSKYKKMKQLIADMRLPEYRYKQLLDAVFLQGIMRFEDMKLLPKTLREKLVLLHFGAKTGIIFSG